MRLKGTTQTGHTYTFCCCELDLDPMTLKYKHGTYILKLYPDAENEVSMSRFSKVRA